MSRKTLQVGQNPSNIRNELAFRLSTIPQKQRINFGLRLARGLIMVIGRSARAFRSPKMGKCAVEVSFLEKFGPGTMNRLI
jgi:hypothetical protein